MDASKELKDRMKIHIKLMIEQYSGHEFDHLTGRCRCGSSIGIWRCASFVRQEILVLNPSVLVDPMRPCKYSEV